MCYRDKYGVWTLPLASRPRLGCWADDLLTATGQNLRFCLAEDPTAWPTDIVTGA